MFAGSYQNAQLTGVAGQDGSVVCMNVSVAGTSHHALPQRVNAFVPFHHHVPGAGCVGSVASEIYGTVTHAGTAAFVSVATGIVNPAQTLGAVNTSPATYPVPAVVNETIVTTPPAIVIDAVAPVP